MLQRCHLRRGPVQGPDRPELGGLAGKGRTLVIYMGVATADDISEKLIADGLSPDTPVAVLERVGRNDGRALRSILTDLGGMIAREAVQSPAIIIVGDVVLKSDAEDKLRAFAG
jgi:uroporphyrin-III C-methyltransferase